MVVAGGASAISGVPCCCRSPPSGSQQHQLVQLLRRAVPRRHHPGLQRAVDRRLPVRLITGTSRLADWDPMDPRRWLQGHSTASVRGGPRWRHLARLARRPQPARAAAPAGSERSARRSNSRWSSTLALVVSPISWSHYYLLLLLPWGLYLGKRLPLARDLPTRRAALRQHGADLSAGRGAAAACGPARRDAGPHRSCRPASSAVCSCWQRSCALCWLERRAV